MFSLNFFGLLWRLFFSVAPALSLSNFLALQDSTAAGHHPRQRQSEREREKQERKRKKQKQRKRKGEKDKDRRRETDRQRGRRTQRERERDRETETDNQPRHHQKKSRTDLGSTRLETGPAP